MRTTTATLTIAGLFGALTALPLAAQEEMDPETMTCADFMAMESEGQMQAMEAMEMASDSMMEGEDGMESDEAMSEGDDSMSSDDGDEMASEDGDAMESEDGESMMSDDGMMDEHMAAMTEACEGNPDMMAMDAMMSGMHE